MTSPLDKDSGGDRSRGLLAPRRLRGDRAALSGRVAGVARSVWLGRHGRAAGPLDLFQALNDSDVGENEIAFAYEYGKGVPQNYDEAAKWYRKAAGHGLAEAQRNLEILAARREPARASGSEESAQTSGGYAGRGQGFVGGTSEIKGVRP